MANELQIMTPQSVPTLLSADKTDILGKLNAELAGYVPDASTQSGRDEIGSKAKKVGTAKQDFVRLAATQKEEHQSIIKLINAELGTIESRCDELRDTILAPRTAYLQIEKDRVAKHEEYIILLTNHAVFLEKPHSDHVRARIESLKSAHNRTWEEFSARAFNIHNEVMEKLILELALAEKYEAEQVELTKLRADVAERERLETIRLQAEHEEKIKAEAADKARKQAEDIAAAAAKVASEAAEQKLAEQKIAEEKALREKQEAEVRAKRAEEEKIAAEQKSRVEAMLALDKAERDKQAAIEEERAKVAAAAKAEADANVAREANTKHRAKVNNEALQAIQLIVDAVPAGDDAVKAIIVAIAKGEVPHVKISY